MYFALKFHRFQPIGPRGLFQALLRSDRLASNGREIAGPGSENASGFRPREPRREKSAASSTLLHEPYFDGLTGPRWW